MNLGSKFNKVKLTADRLFTRGDKTDVIGDLRDAESRAEELRILIDAACRSLEKKLYTYHVNDEKKYKKIPENQVAETLKDACKEIGINQVHEVLDKTLLQSVVEETISTETVIGKLLLDYEEQVESEVLNLLSSLKEDFHSLSKQKKLVKQAGQDLDAAKARLRNSMSNAGQVTKVEVHRNELDDAEAKLEQIRDSYACDLFAALGREREIGRLLYLNMELKLEYLQKSVSSLSTLLPSMKKVIDESCCGAVYSIPLHQHLSITSRKIALPIEACVKQLIENGIREEGLFRVAGGALKIKRLRGAFDAGVISVESMDEYGYDVHVVAGALKSYLRDLPEPLLTYLRHDQWVEAVKLSEHDERLKALWKVVNSLPSHNLENLQYFIRFLCMLSKYSQDNKMTSVNLAIIIAPNLIWSQKEEELDLSNLSRNMTVSNDYRTVVEQLIEYCDYFFKEIDFGVQPKPPSPKLGRSSPNGAVPTLRHRRTGSTDFAEGDLDSPKQPHRNKKKPAPKPPPVDPQSPTMKRSHSPPAKIPSPAPRLSYTSSLRRPTVEPPRPPTKPISKPNTSPPPRPNPPESNIGFEKLVKNFESEATLDNEVTKVSHSKEKINGEIHKSEQGMEKSQSNSKETLAEIEIEVEIKENNKIYPKLNLEVEIAGDSKPKRLDEVFKSKSTERLNVQLGDEVTIRETPAGTSAEFRRSLEGVLKQPQAKPRHFGRSSPSDGLKGTSPIESEKIQLPGFTPTPAQRISKEDKLDSKCERPAVPEKPATLNKENTRPVVPEKPATLHRPKLSDGSSDGFDDALKNNSECQSIKKDKMIVDEDSLASVKLRPTSEELHPNPSTHL